MADEEDLESEYGLNGGQKPEQDNEQDDILGKILGGLGIAAIIPIPMPSKLEDLVAPPRPEVVAKLQHRLDDLIAEAKKWRAENEGPPTQEFMQVIGQVAQTHSLLMRAKSLVN